jgi:hypothetical protein
MKWSIVTGALVDRGVTTFLAELPVDRSLRFDTWYAASPELKCHVDVRCLPRERWTSGGEALEILQSYPFRGLGSSLVISGGVTLGGRRSIEAASKIEPTLARGLRRADVNYAESTERLIVQLRGTRVELPDVTANGIAKATTHLDDSVRLRSGASELAADEISTAVHVADARSVVSIESNIGSLGNLAYERSPALDVLSWTPGRIEIEQQLCSELAARGAYSLDDLGSAVSASDACIASEGRIVVERGANLFVVEPPDALNPGRVFRISEGAAESPGVVQAAHGSRLREMLGKDPIVRCAVEPWEAGSSAARALDDAPWAKISLLESGTAGDAPGVFRQVLTDQGPSATSRPIQISFDLPGREKLEAFVTEDGYVLVKRPEGTSGRALAELTADHLTPRQVEAMLDESVAVGQVFHVGVDSTQSVAVARQLEKDVRALRMGYRNEEAAEFWRSMSGETRDSADGLLYGALRSIEDHGLSKAATAVDRALERGGLRLDTIEAAQQMARLRGQDAIADYLLVNADMLSDVSVDVARALRLECRGYRANTVLELGSHRAESTIADFASELEVWADAPVYIEQKSDVLARYDWDALPGPSMAKVARDVNMRWSSLEIDGLGVFRPDELILDGTRFVRRGGDLGRFVGRTYVNGDSQPSGGGTIPPRDLASRLPYRGCGCSAECSCGCLSGGTCNCSHASQRDEATRRDETEPAPDSGAIEPGADAAEETDVSDPSVDGEPDELGDLFDFELPGPQPATVLLLRKAG